MRNFLDFSRFLFFFSYRCYWANVKSLCLPMLQYILKFTRESQTWNLNSNATYYFVNKPTKNKKNNNMILTRFLLRNRPNINVSTCACKFYTITAKPKRQEHPRWFNQNWIRGFPTESKIVSRGAENGFAYKIVKNAGIPVFNKPQDSSIFEQVVNTNGSEQALEELEARVHQLSDTDLVSNLNDLAPLKESDYFTKVWKIVDDEGSKRVPNADPSVVLAGAMKIYEMEMTYRSEWVWSCLKRFCRRLDRLTKAEVSFVIFSL